MTDRKFANTLARGLSVLRAFRISDDGLSHSQIVERTGISAATITRLTYTLKELGYLSQNGNLLRLGPSALALASLAQASASFMDLAAAPMQELANKTQTLVLMAVRDGGSMTLVRTWRPRNAGSIWLETGNRVPMSRSSTGQAFLAALSDAQFSAMEPDADLTDQRQFAHDQLSSQGFVFVQGAARFSKRVNAVSRPFFASNFGEPVVFGCGATPEELTDERILNEVGPALRDSMRDLELKTGGRRALDQLGL
ncbi:MAG: IclR family transcriptional regulator [Pelagimonas sp.]|uniref:IclR family transcriptional regulator n=1 Tax=Pelagimonas sp. TaxID=2073170 RepID=UPI003D6AAAD8